jgi:hypothetical protein
VALSWWPIALAGFLCLAVAVALAAVMPTERESRRLRPLAHTTRLTRLPEYARLARARTLSMIAAIALLITLFAAAVLTSARPSGWWWSTASSQAPEDIMLCVGQPVTDPVSRAFLSHFAQQVRTYGTQRIGLTSANRRVVPMTRDYQYAAQRLGEAAELARMDALHDLSPAQRSALRNGVAAFTAPVDYVDYAAGLTDVLALCMTGFPSFEEAGTHRRSLIYLGPGEIRRPGEQRPSMFNDQQVTDMAAAAGIQINAIATTGPGPLRPVVESTGGQYFSARTDTTSVAGDLDAIRAHPPKPAVPQTATVTGWLSDAPTIPLNVAVVISALLCVALVVLRR